MSGFFRSWQHKAGCCTLVLALLLTAVWIRGMIEPKSVDFQIGKRKHILTTNTGRCIWMSYDKIEGQSLLDEQRVMTPFLPDTPPDQIIRSVDFLRPVVCLTLISAFLILWKTRNRD